jgi:hypothetical protein
MVQGASDLAVTLVEPLENLGAWADFFTDDLDNAPGSEAAFVLYGFAGLADTVVRATIFFAPSWRPDFVGWRVIIPLGISRPSRSSLRA